MKIVIVDFGASKPSFPTNLRAMIRRCRVVSVVMAKDVAAAAPGIDNTAKLVAARVIEAVVFDENKLLAALICGRGPRTIAV
jgi:hypothetical protein